MINNELLIEMSGVQKPNSQIIFACFSPHPPIILPSVGLPEDREKTADTIRALDFLGGELEKLKPDKIIISSPHPDWGFNVPLFFLTRRSSKKEGGLATDYIGEIKKRLIGLESPASYFQQGKEFYQSKILNLQSKIALIGSGDLSHRLKQDGPYGLHPDGPEFDRALIKYLKEKNIGDLLKLDQQFPEAGECGLRSFAFILGILSGMDYKPEILSYEAPFGVGYLVVNFIL